MTDADPNGYGILLVSWNVVGLVFLMIEVVDVVHAINRKGSQEGGLESCHWTVDLELSQGPVPLREGTIRRKTFAVHISLDRYLMGTNFSPSTYIRYTIVCSTTKTKVTYCMLLCI